MTLERFVAAFNGEPWIPVTLRGHEGVSLFVEPAVLRGEWAGPLAPPHHLGDDGRLSLARPAWEESYAHVFSDGLIRRYGVVVGELADLTPTDAPRRLPSSGEQL